MFYDRKIKYLDYYENGERIKGCGFVKLEVRDGSLRMEVKVAGLHPTDSFERDILLCAEKQENTIGKMVISQGRGNYLQVCNDLDNLGGVGLSYGELRGIRIPVGTGREISSSWQEQKEVSRGEPAGEAAWGTKDGRETGGDARETSVFAAVQEAREGVRGTLNSAAVQEARGGVRGTLNSAAGQEAREGVRGTSDSAAVQEAREGVRGTSDSAAVQEARGGVRGTSAVGQEVRESVWTTVGQEVRENVQGASAPVAGRETREGVQGASTPAAGRETREGVRGASISAAGREDGEGKGDTQDTPGRERGNRSGAGGIWGTGEIADGETGSTDRIRQSGKTAQREESRVIMDMADKRAANKEETTSRNGRQNAKSAAKTPVKLMEDKWSQLWAIYPHVRPFRDGREYLSIEPADFVLFSSDAYKMVNNSFLLHGYYNYSHLILTRLEKKGEILYYIGAPGNYYEREKQVAIMFGFESFECAEEPAQTGDFGYYMMRTEL